MLLLFAAWLSGTVDYMKAHRDAAERYAEAFATVHSRLASLSFLLEEQASSVYYQITLDQVIGEWLLQAQPSIGNMYLLGQIQDNSLRLINSNPLVVSIYIYSRTSGTVLSTNHEFMPLTLFPERELFTAAEKNGRWVGARKEKAGYSNPKEILTFVGPLGDNGLVAINVDERRLLGDLPDGYGALLLGRQNTVLSTRGSAERKLALQEPQRPWEAPDASGRLLEWGTDIATVSDHKGGEWRLVTTAPGIEQSSDWLVRRQVIAVLLLGLLAQAVLLYRYARRAYFQPIEHLEGSYRRHLEDLKHQTVMHALTGKLKDEELEDKMKELHLPFHAGRCLVIVFQIDDFYHYLLQMKRDERFFMDKTVYSAIKWTFMTTYDAFAVKVELEKIAILLAVPDEADEAELRGRVEQTIRYLQDEIRSTCSLTLCVGLSEVQDGLNAAHTGYYEALRAIGFKTLYGKHSLIRYADIAQMTTEEPVCRLPDAGKLAGLVRDGQIDEFGEALRAAIEKQREEERFSPERINGLLSNVLYGIVKAALEQRLDVAEIVREDAFLKLFGYEFVEDKTAYVLEVAAKVADRLAARKHPPGRTTQLIVDYIQAHYDQSISLTMMCDALGINSSYTSTLMKQELGMGFVDYVNQLRIRKAVQLLEDPGVSVKHIAEQCGYDTVHSFIRNFKKLQLFTPTEYRNKLLSRRNV